MPILKNFLFSDCFLLSLFFVLTTTALSTEDNADGFFSGSTKSCPEYYRNDVRVPCFFLGEKCYCFSTQMFLMAWNDAKYYCRLNNYTLISLETKAEDDLIHQHIETTELLSELPWFWTSGTYSEDQWKWSTSPLPGEPFSYSNWASTRPIYNMNGYCTEINYSTFQGAWVDFPCDFTNYFICEGNSTFI
ncbi:hypothetical protein DAPPUDRAFT_309284 [Daphnia pulex]|uniref:C-type lectin domain-containing protein n=1 Tax=Daphnia pulex TaxID=6669 RepID=E9HBW0_DAPPU|nr:hypothetical protein DAPPUDRAFT_309284 [Daphnia pulex]|eukprot:EFX70787.1 hypothetical protein DAPPUDRAFT_309284 [Daphnia pulex]